MSVEELFDAQRRFAARFPSVPMATVLDRVEHTCSSGCNWLRFGRVCICQDTNALHLCDALVCDHLEETPEHQVCTLTAYCYPLEYGVGYDQDGVAALPPLGGGARRPSAIATRRDPLDKRVRSASPALTRETPSPVLSVCRGSGALTVASPLTASPCPSPPPPPAFAGRAFSGRSATNADSNNAMMVAQAATLLRELTRGRMPADNVEYMVGRAIRFWVVLSATSEFQRIANVYKFNYHCIVTFYHAIDGLQVDNRWLIRPIAAARQLLPLENQLHEFGITTNKHQRATKQFNACLQQVIASRSVVQL